MSRRNRVAPLLVVLALAVAVAGIGGCAAGDDVKSAASNAVKAGERAAGSAGNAAKKAGQKAVSATKGAAKKAGSVAKKAAPNAAKVAHDLVPFVEIHSERDRRK